MILVSDVWKRVRDILLLPDDDSVLSRQRFLELLTAAVNAFCVQSRSVVGIVGGYANEEGAVPIERAADAPVAVLYEGKSLAPSLPFSMGESYSHCPPPSEPTQWSSEPTGVGWIRVEPKPSKSPGEVDPDSAFYGTISDTDLLETTLPFYGTIGSAVIGSRASAFSYLGTMSGFHPGPGAIVAIVPITITAIRSLDAAIDGIPEEFESYITFGVLAEIFSTSSELKDPLRASYCRTRFAEGVAIAQALFRESLL